MKLKILQICTKSISIWGRCRKEGEWEREKKKAWDNIQNYSATGFSICQEQKNVFLKWIAHKMLNEVSIRSSIKSAIIWWKEYNFSRLKWSEMLKKYVAKYYIWRTAAAYFAMIFIIFHSTKLPGESCLLAWTGMLPSKFTLKRRWTTVLRVRFWGCSGHCKLERNNSGPHSQNNVVAVLFILQLAQDMMLLSNWFSQICSL